MADLKDLALDNTKLEEAIMAALADKTNVEAIREMITAFANSTVIVPANFPPGIPPQIFKMAREGRLKPEQMPKMVPTFIKNPDGQKFAPCFTSVAKIEAHMEKAKGNKNVQFAGYIKLPASEIIKTVLEPKTELDGVLVNMGSEGLTINKKGLASLQIKKEVKMTREQFIVFARQQADNGFLPKRAFEQKGEFMKAIDEQREKLVYDTYKIPYGDKLEFPYTIEQFGVMVLGIEDGLTVACIELPDKGPANTAISSYIFYFEKEDEIRYFLIEKRVGENNVLIEIMKDGKREELASAPTPGSELYTIMDIIRDDEE